MKLKRSDVGRWAMIKWSDGDTTGIIVDADEGGGQVFASGTYLLHSIDHEQVIKTGRFVKFDPVALGLNKL